MGLLYYCKYCGKSRVNKSDLIYEKCGKHPNGFGKGTHEIYGGSTPKSYYTCKWCGRTSASIDSLTDLWCRKHPNGNGKGRCEPE